MLGGAVAGLPTSAAAAASAAAVAVAAHKQFHPNSPPLDLDSWKEAFLAANNNKDESNNETTEDGVSSTAGGAINLSSRPSSVQENATNQGSGNSNTPTIVEPDSQEDQGKLQKESEKEGKLSPLQALFSPPGLQQMQQFLQQVANNGGPNNSGSGGGNSFNPAQLHHLMQQQQNFLSHHQQQLADAGRKQLEQLLHQLQEQLQINLLQQTHLMQNSGSSEKPGGNKTSQAMQQLQIQQQQLISQLQLVQQRLLMLPNFGGNRKDGDFEKSWKENGNENNSPSPKISLSKKDEQGGRDDSSPVHQHPLFQHGVCQWPGCDANFTDLVLFLKHVGHEHVLDDKSTAQARVQMQIVAQLEHSLSKERERLQAMMAHLHMTKDGSKADSVLRSKPILDRNERSQSEGPPSHPISPPVSSVDRPKSPSPLKMRPPPVPPLTGSGGPPGTLAAMQQAVSAAAAAAGGFGHLPNFSSHANIGLPPTPLSALTAAARGSAAAAAAAAAAAGLTHPPTSMANHIRRRMAEKAPPLPMSNGLPYMFDRAGLDIAQEIHRNREFYRTNDVRPPFTYASLIRQAIVESPTGQLKLGEIYTWFSNNFKHFRTTCNLTWKNAIRTNLSLHKCFVRYEDDFGSFWMVDDAEFMKRRHLSRGRPRKYEPNSAQTQQNKHENHVTSHVTSSNTNEFKLAPGSQAKSPSFAPNPSMYSEALNASLQSALGFAENNLPFLAHSGAAAASMASFHHHQQQREREEKQGLERPSSVEYASKLLGSNASSSYLSPSSMSDSENNNNHDKIEENSRKRPASADLEDLEEEDLHFNNKTEHGSVQRNFDYFSPNSSGNPGAASADLDQRSSSSPSIKEEISLKDITMLRNPNPDPNQIKREKH